MLPVLYENWPEEPATGQPAWFGPDAGYYELVQYWTPSTNCRVCDRLSVPGSYLCEVCRHLMGRIETRKDVLGHGRRVNREARLEALRKQWDPQIDAFRCYFTAVPMTGTHGSRRYATWEHLVPGDESSVVLVTDLVNKMKSDMTEDEFKTIVRALTRRFDGESFDEHAFPPDTKS